MNANRTSSMLLAALLAASLVRASSADPPPAWELWPYRVQVLVAVDDEVSLPLPPLQQRISAAAGGTWKLEVTAAASDLRQSMLDDIEAVEEESLAAADNFDKVILLAAASRDGRLSAIAREIDLSTGLWNATIRVPSPQPEYLPHAAVRAVLTAFAPLARIEKTDGQTVTLKLRASGLMPAGQSPLLDGNAIFRPVLVPCDAGGTITRGNAKLIDWTYLTAKESGSSTIECRMETALAGDVIPAYHPLRQRWAILVSRSSGSTQLRLVSRADNAEPLEGIEVAAEGNPPVVIGHSDRRGEVLVPPGDSPVRTIVARQGDEVLARLLIVPGLQRELVVPVNYDRRLVEVEALLQQLADDVIDAAARRALKQQPAASNVDTLLTRLDRLAQAVQSTAPATRRRLEPKLTELRKGLEQVRGPAK